MEVFFNLGGKTVRCVPVKIEHIQIPTHEVECDLNQLQDDAGIKIDSLIDGVLKVSDVSGETSFKIVIQKPGEDDKVVLGLVKITEDETEDAETVKGRE